MKDGTAWEESRAVPLFLCACCKCCNFLGDTYSRSEMKDLIQMRRTKRMSQKQKTSFGTGPEGGRVKRSVRYSFPGVTLSGQFWCSVSFEMLVDRSGNGESRLC